MARWKRASRRQWFQDDYPGARIDANICVVHTTEGGSWPSYSGGATAPHFTARPDYKRKRLVFRQHFDTNRSARALRNEAGGVETNTLNAVQIELIGTCDKATARKYGVMYWPEAPDWALRDLARFLRWLHKHSDMPLKDAGKRWPAYPASYGNSPARMSFHQWRNAYGVAGHMHVPENSHGDPGNIDIGRILAFARGKNPGGDGKPDKGKGSRVHMARRLLWQAIQYAKDHKWRRRARRLRKARRTLPKK